MSGTEALKEAIRRADEACPSGLMCVPSICDWSGHAAIRDAIRAAAVFGFDCANDAVLMHCAIESILSGKETERE